MEIERKFLVKTLPAHLENYPHNEIEQGYLNREPVLRIRRMDDTYIFTYKGKGFLARQEAEFPLSKDAYEHLKSKIDGHLIKKIRYRIPFGSYTVELDIFHGSLRPLILAEVEFPTAKEAQTFLPPDWFGEDVTFCEQYHNSFLSLHGYTPGR